MNIPSLFFSLLLAFSSSALAFKVESQDVPSKAMAKTIPVSIVLPKAYEENPAVPLPVLYLLHGAGDNNSTWLNATSISSLADQFGIIIVSPSSDISWYFDSPEIPSSKYETFISTELVTYIDSHYRTRANRLFRALLGNSMGGHGALFLGIRHKDLFATAVSISGGVDFRPFPKNWNLDKLLGNEKDHPDRWNDLTVLNQAKKLKDGDLAISIDVGVYDFFVEGNRALHRELLDQKVAHDYTERPGYHGWPYWANAIPYQMLYISNRFKENEAKAPKAVSVN